MAVDRLSAGKAAYGLVDDSLENRSSQIFPRSAFVDQRLDIGFGKYAAARCDWVNLLIIFGIFI